MRFARRTVAALQRSQLSVQALTRLSSVVIFLLASWTDQSHLALVALQGTLLAIPYTLIEALVGRPLSAGLVPAGWDLERWARRAAVVTIVPVGAVAYLSALIALPDVTPWSRLAMIAPVLLQLPLEAAFWSTARTRSRQLANLVPQLTAAGTLVAGAVLALTHQRLDVAAVPAQLLVLGWVWLRRGGSPGRTVRPPYLASVRVGSTYCLAAGVDLSYSVALPSVAGRIVGVDAIVVLRAMELAFGPFHVALSASTREDIVGGSASRFLTGTRMFTGVLLVAVSAAVLGSSWVRGVLADELTRVAVGVIALFCVYKAMLAVSTWLSVRHMIRAAPRRFLVSAVGSRVVAFGGLAVSIAVVHRVSGLFLQLAATEAAVVVWYALRARGTPPKLEPERMTTLDPAASA
ncbi:hypothetical protein OHA72_60210 [Dactylosporangium sp. NBC_01737]|uniref:hypothetical protein n=1 Tax=Dactylosporangium sp. NBC_01737 TaxID=2975959 RepID=UPI002E102E16|nr:hypothetical protein OHA72_60210 [Dactylosporangium sp. NBC_01737]